MRVRFGWITLVRQENHIENGKIVAYGHVKRRNEGHMLRRMVDTPVAGVGEEDGNPGGETRVKEISIKSRVKRGGHNVLDMTTWTNAIHNHSGEPR